MAKANYANLPINHDDEPIRLFKSDFLEFFTHIHPAAVLVLFVPVVVVFLARSILTSGPDWHVATILVGYAGGILIWSFSEYILHRYMFHYEPRQPWLQRVWYLIHGVHHEQPQCKTRLVMPPILSIPLALLFYGVFYLVLGVVFGVPKWIGPLFAGFVTGYLMYDMIHYATHHLSMRWSVLKFLKRYHLLHHFKTPDVRYGISSPIWDVVFGTKPKKS